MKSKKETKRRRLEEIAKDGNAFCKKHRKYLDIKEVIIHKCYTGNHGRNYCSYLEIKQ